MNPELTTEQKNQLSKWAVQRDSVLLEIAKNREENEKLIVSNKRLSESGTEIENRIQQYIGRILELEIKENQFSKLTLSENVALVAEKSVLQTEVHSLKSEINNLLERKEQIFNDIAQLSKVHDTVFNNSTQLEKVINEIVTRCSGNAREVGDILKLVEEKCKEILTLSTENIGAHTEILNKIPRLFVELRKKSMERDIIIKHKT